MPFRYVLLTPIPWSFIDPARPLPATALPMRYVPFDVGTGAEVKVPEWIETFSASDGLRNPRHHEQPHPWPRCGDC